jgi:hypothetical protein
MASEGRPTISRRALLVGLVLTPPVLAACSGGDKRPDPLIALADSARADAALTVVVAAAKPELGEKLDPLRVARTEHAAALDAEVVKLDPSRASATPAAPPTADQQATLPALKEALQASATAAAQVALDLPVERVGLVASIAACCATYSVVLG